MVINLVIGSIRKKIDRDNTEPANSARTEGMETAAKIVERYKIPSWVFFVAFGVLIFNALAKFIPQSLQVENQGPKTEQHEDKGTDNAAKLEKEQFPIPIAHAIHSQGLRPAPAQ